MGDKICENCKYWGGLRNDESQHKARPFGKCYNPNTYSWVRGQSFEPPGDFGCLNFINYKDEEND